MRAAKANVGRYQTTGAGAVSATAPRGAAGLGADASSKLCFTPRQVPLSPATRGGFVVFVVFLASFTAIIKMERNDHVFFFAEHARQ